MHNHLITTLVLANCGSGVHGDERDGDSLPVKRVLDANVWPMLNSMNAPPSENYEGNPLFSKTIEPLFYL